MIKLVLLISVLLINSTALAGNNTDEENVPVFSDQDLIRYRQKQETADSESKKLPERIDRSDDRNGVSNAGAVDTRIANSLKDTWNSHVALLKKGHTENALKYVCPIMRPQYSEMFKALGSNIKQIVATQIDLKVLYVFENMAKCELTTNEKGQLYSYEVTFVKDQTGAWCISQY